MKAAKTKSRKYVCFVRVAGSRDKYGRIAIESTRPKKELEKFLKIKCKYQLGCKPSLYTSLCKPINI